MGVAGKNTPRGTKKGGRGGGEKKGVVQRKKRGSCREGWGLCPLQESLKIDLLEERASCEALPVNDRLNYLSSFVNKRMAAYTIAKITTQMNHFMLSPPFFLKFWKEICVSSQNVLV